MVFYDELTENKKYKGKYDISYSSLYNAFLNDDIISPIAHKGTIKLYNKRMNNTNKRKKVIPPKNHPWRKKNPVAGILLFSTYSSIIFLYRSNIDL